MFKKQTILLKCLESIESATFLFSVNKILKVGGKDTSCPPWWPEFNLQYPHDGRREQIPLVVLWLPHIRCGTHEPPHLPPTYTMSNNFLIYVKILRKCSKVFLIR